MEKAKYETEAAENNAKIKYPLPVEHIFEYVANPNLSDII
jgi:hypothetical protein